MKLMKCELPSSKIRSAMVVAGTLCYFSAASFFAQEKAWTVDDYLRALPEKFKTYSGDFEREPSRDRTIKDLKNGYIAYLDKVPAAGGSSPAFPVFEIAVFKQASGEPLVVVSNYRYDMVCTTHDTFFLRKQGSEWVDVRAKVLPKLSAGMFFTQADLGRKFESANKEAGNVESAAGWFYLHFSPPRHGTRMKVALDICDHVPEEKPELSFDEFEAKQKPVWLEWEQKKGTFKVSHDS